MAGVSVYHRVPRVSRYRKCSMRSYIFLNYMSVDQHFFPQGKIFFGSDRIINEALTAHLLSLSDQYRPLLQKRKIGPLL